MAVIGPALTHYRNYIELAADVKLIKSIVLNKVGSNECDPPRDRSLRRNSGESGFVRIRPNFSVRGKGGQPT